jgi:hypothetical protein
MKEDGDYHSNTDRFRTYIREHLKKLAHFRSVLQQVRMNRIYLQAVPDKQPSQPSNESKRLQALTNVFRAVFTLGLSNTTSFAFPRLVEPLRSSGATVGSRINTRWTANRLTKFIGDSMHQSIMDYLVKSNSPVTILLDGSSDRKNNNYMFVYFQAVAGSRTVVHFYKLLKFGKTSNAAAYRDILLDPFREDSEACFNYIKNNVTDVAANMVSFQSLFETWVVRKDESGRRIAIFKIFFTSHKLNSIT